MSNSKILVLGAGGFIGNKLCEKIKAGLSQITLVPWFSDHDITQPAIIEEIVLENPDVIVIAVGKSFVPDSWISPLNFYTINTLGTIYIAEAARKINAKIVFLSTFVYGEPYRLPIKENNSVRPLNPYASSKFAAEQILKDYHRHFSVESNVLRVFNVYGKGQRESFLIPTLINQYKNNKKIVVKDLFPKRDYIHIDDLIGAILAAIKNFNGFEVYNVASGKSYSVQEIIDVIFQVNGHKTPVISENSIRINEVNDTCADITKINEKLNWKPLISIEEGISKLLE